MFSFCLILKWDNVKMKQFVFHLKRCHVSIVTPCPHCYEPDDLSQQFRVSLLSSQGLSTLFFFGTKAAPLQRVRVTFVQSVCSMTNRKWRGLTLIGSLRGSSSQTVCPERTSAPGWKWAAPLWTGPCRAAPASVESRSETYSPLTPSLSGQPHQPGQGDMNNDERGYIYILYMYSAMILSAQHSFTRVHMLQLFVQLVCKRSVV